MNPKWASLALLPLLAGIGFFAWQSEQMTNLHQRAIELQQRSQASEKEEKKETAIRLLLREADRKYLEEKLETLVFLQPEMKRLQALSLHRKDPEMLLQRLDFLKSGKNQLVFVEGERRNLSGSIEVEEKTQHPIEINDEDLKRLLVLIEGRPIDPYSPPQGRPHLAVKNFDLSKKKSPLDEEVYVVNFELIKREVGP